MKAKVTLKQGENNGEYSSYVPSKEDIEKLKQSQTMLQKIKSVGSCLSNNTYSVELQSLTHKEYKKIINFIIKADKTIKYKI